jgi:hypothetical protein
MAISKVGAPQGHVAEWLRNGLQKRRVLFGFVSSGAEMCIFIGFLHKHYEPSCYLILPCADSFGANSGANFSRWIGPRSAERARRPRQWRGVPIRGTSS